MELYGNFHSLENCSLQFGKKCSLLSVCPGRSGRSLFFATSGTVFECQLSKLTKTWFWMLVSHILPAVLWPQYSTRIHLASLSSVSELLSLNFEFSYCQFLLCFSVIFAPEIFSWKHFLKFIVLKCSRSLFPAFIQILKDCVFPQVKILGEHWPIINLQGTAFPL